MAGKLSHYGSHLLLGRGSSLTVPQTQGVTCDLAGTHLSIPNNNAAAAAALFAAAAGQELSLPVRTCRVQHAGVPRAHGSCLLGKMK